MSTNVQKDLIEQLLEAMHDELDLRIEVARVYINTTMTTEEQNQWWIDSVWWDDEDGVWYCELEETK